MGLTPFYGAGAEKPLQKADFAMKQTNICRFSGDITRRITFLALRNPLRIQKVHLSENIQYISV